MQEGQQGAAEQDSSVLELYQRAFKGVDAKIRSDE